MTGYSSYGLAFGWHLHHVFVAITLVGAILFVLWASRLKPTELKKLVTWSLIIGVVGMLLTSAFTFGSGWPHPGSSYKGMGWGENGMMMDRDDMIKEMREYILPGEAS